MSIFSDSMTLVRQTVETSCVCCLSLNYVTLGLLYLALKKERGE